MQEPTTCIDVKNLSVWYGQQKVLKDVTVGIREKSITAIIGPSGCGKTTLLKSLNRLIDLQLSIRRQGLILLHGKDIYDPAVDVMALRKRMGMLFQRPQVLPMSIYENVAYGPRIHHIKNKKVLDETVEYYLHLAGLWNEVKDRLSSPASALSIGQQQRLCLARGLAVEPEMILADEPTSALDPISAERIEQRFLELKESYTIVLVTHILRQARRLADNVVFLYLGDLVEAGPAEQVFGNPSDPRTKAYIQGRFIEPDSEPEEAAV